MSTQKQVDENGYFLHALRMLPEGWTLTGEPVILDGLFAIRATLTKPSGESTTFVRTPPRIPDIVHQALYGGGESWVWKGDKS